MIHYSCDRCFQPIDTETELRFEVRLEMQVAFDQSDKSPADDDDTTSLDEIDDLLRRVDDEECEQLCRHLHQTRKYDLCQSCYEKFQDNPLASEMPNHFDFSKN